MLKRISLTLTVKDGVFTKTRQFNPEHLYSENHIAWNSFDEVNILNLDGEITDNYKKFIENIRRLINIPLTLSGGVQSKEGADKLFELGADRIIINTGIWKTSIDYINDISNKYGRQSIIASIDISKVKGRLCAYNWKKQELYKSMLPNSIENIRDAIGEILVQDQENDGRINGANIKKMREIITEISLKTPIHIGSAGITKWDHYIELLQIKEIDAVSVSNVHHMSKKAIDELRLKCKMAGLRLRQTCESVINV